MDEEQIKKETERVEGSTLKAEGGFNILSVSPNYHILSNSSDKYSKGRLNIKDRNYFGFKDIERDLDGKILVYEDRVKGWFLDFAKMLIKEQHAGFVVILICTSYLEGNQQFREGKLSKGVSSEMLIKSLKRILKIKRKNTALTLFVEEVRHGLFHDGMTRKNVEINSSLKNPFYISKDKKRILINPELLLFLIENDFEDYISMLKDSKNKKERRNFEKCWKVMYDE